MRSLILGSFFGFLDGVIGVVGFGTGTVDAAVN